MSRYVWTDCACGGDIVSVSPDEDDVRIAVASHQESPKHEAWAAVQRMIQDGDTRNGPCICKGGPAGPIRFREGAARWPNAVKGGRVA